MYLYYTLDFEYSDGPLYFLSTLFTSTIVLISTRGIAHSPTYPAATAQQLPAAHPTSPTHQ